MYINQGLSIDVQYESGYVDWMQKIKWGWTGLWEDNRNWNRFFTRQMMDQTWQSSYGSSPTLKLLPDDQISVKFVWSNTFKFHQFCLIKLFSCDVGLESVWSNIKLVWSNTVWSNKFDPSGSTFTLLIFSYFPEFLCMYEECHAQFIVVCRLYMSRC